VSETRILPRAQVSTERSQHIVREVVETVLLTLLIFFAVHFSVQPYRVDGPSMQPGLHTGDLVLVNLLTYNFSSPQRGDVVVFHPPCDPKSPVPPELGAEPANCDSSLGYVTNYSYVKRIIGIPGDTISVTAAAIYVDGTKLDEPYTAPLSVGESENPVVISSLKLGKDEYFVLGDNRLNSMDSRVFPGPVTRSMIIGKAEVLVFPFNHLEWLHGYSNVFAGVKQK
jgi:signal peptidase I